MSCNSSKDINDPWERMTTMSSFYFGPRRLNKWMAISPSFKGWPIIKRSSMIIFTLHIISYYFSFFVDFREGIKKAKHVSMWLISVSHLQFIPSLNNTIDRWYNWQTQVVTEVWITCKIKWSCCIQSLWSRLAISLFVPGTIVISGKYRSVPSRYCWIFW